MPPSPSPALRNWGSAHCLPCSPGAASFPCAHPGARQQIFLHIRGCRVVHRDAEGPLRPEQVAQHCPSCWVSSWLQCGISWSPLPPAEPFLWEEAGPNALPHQGRSPKMLGMRGPRSGWAGTPGTLVRLARQKPSCTFPAAGIGCFRVAGAGLGWKVLLWSCLGQALAPALCWMWVIRSPGLLRCPRGPQQHPWAGLPGADSPFPSSTARTAVRPSWGLSPRAAGACQCCPLPSNRFWSSPRLPCCPGGPQQHCCSHPGLVCP